MLAMATTREPLQDDVLSQSTPTNGRADKENDVTVIPPTVKRKCDVRLYVLNFSLLNIFSMMSMAYNVGVLRTLERKFDLNSKESGLILSMNDISHILVVTFVGYLGRKAHKPRVMSSFLLLVALAAFLMASPALFFPGYPLEGATGHTHMANSNNGVNNNNNSDSLWIADNGRSTHDNGPDHHVGRESTYCSSGNDTEESCQPGQDTSGSGIHGAYVIFLIAQFIAGVGNSGTLTLGVTYLDENAPRDKSSLYLGIMTSSFAVGPMSGILLSALTLRLPENLDAGVRGSPSDPLWIGCWWLGYVIAGTLVCLACIPMWFFPKNIIPPASREQFDVVYKKSNKDAVHRETRNPDAGVKEQIKDFPKELWNLLKNPPYVMKLLCNVFTAYLIAALYINIPRYIQIHFLQPAYIASIITGTVSAGAGVIGGFLGGFFMSRWKLKPAQAVILLLCSTLSMIVCLATMTTLSCPQLDFGGHWNQDTGMLEVNTACNSHCSCPSDKRAFQPVCGSDNFTYFSACHAGCTSLDNGTFADCSCAAGDDTASWVGDVGTAVAGYCERPCKLFIVYVVMLALHSLLGSIGRVPSTIVQLRVVDDDNRSFALGFGSFMMNLVGFIPGPLLFGALIDWTCVLWQETCMGTGSCLLYNTDYFRFITHGGGLFFEMLSLITTILLFVFIRKMVFRNHVEDVELDKVEGEDQKPLQA